MFACIHGPDAGRLADSFSPFVETVDERTAVFSVTSRQLRGLKDMQAAVAATPAAPILSASPLSLSLNAPQRPHSVPSPTRDVKLLLKLVEHSLERQPPEAPVGKVRLELIPTAPRRIQHGLFTPAAPKPEKLELTLGKI